MTQRNPSESVFYPRAACNLAFAAGGRNAARDLIRVEQVDPIELNVESNNIHTADTFTVTLDGDLFPVDPASLDAVVVDLFVGDVGSLDGTLARNADSRLLLGHADEIELDLPTDQRPRVRLKGRDYTGFLLDLVWGDRKLELGRGLDELVGEVLASYPSTENLAVRSLLDGAMPVVPKGSSKKLESYHAKSSDKVWDVLQKLSRLVGVILTVRGDEVLIQPPQNVDTRGAQKHPVFVDGLNLRDLSVRRRFTRDDLPNILVVARDPATGARVSGSWPQPPNQRVKISKAKSKTTRAVDRPFREYRSNHPAPTSSILELVARRIYEGFAQQQLEISFSTRELVIIEQTVGQPVERATHGFRVPSIRNGTPIRVHIDRRVRELLDVAPTVEARELVAREAGFKSRVAETLAQSWRTLDRLFSVETASHRFSQSDGYELSCKAVNFLEV